MPKRVLDVGNCGFDRSSLRQFLKQNFSVELVSADTAVETLTLLRQQAFDLVLINRKLDIDYSDGIDIIRQIKADTKLADTPVMLITNYPDHQQEAIRAGAAPGFGKLQLGKSETVTVLEPYLS